MFFNFFYISTFLKNITLIISAVITYKIKIPVMIAANLSGGTTKTNCVANGVNGNAAVITNASKLNDINSFPGMLFSNDLCVLTTNRINNSVQIDSMNHPVWNISASALNNLYSA